MTRYTCGHHADTVFDGRSHWPGELLSLSQAVGAAVGSPFPSVLPQWARVSTRAQAIYQAPQSLYHLCRRESLPTSFWPTWWGWKECGQEQEAPCCEDEKPNVTAALTPTHGERGTTARHVQRSNDPSQKVRDSPYAEAVVACRGNNI